MLDLWQHFDVEIRLRNRIYGGIPKNPNILEPFIRASTGLADSILSDVVERTKKETGMDKLSESDMDKLSEFAWTGFKGGNGTGEQLYIEGRQIKAMLKEAANVLREIMRITAFKSKIAERVFLHEEKIYLGTENPDGYDEGPIHAMTPQGPISAIKRVDYVIKPVLTFTLRCLLAPIKQDAGERDEKGKVIKRNLYPEDYLPLLFEYAQENGLGADRSQEKGKFDATVTNAVKSY